MKTNVKNKKYILTNQTICVDGHTLHRIVAIRNFSNVEAGDFGGFVESEENLSHDGNCWIADDAKVYAHARISGNAWVGQNATIFQHAKVYGAAEVCGSAKVYGFAEVKDCAKVSEQAEIYGHAHINNYARIKGFAKIGGETVVNNRVCLYGNTILEGDFMIFQTADNNLDEYTLFVK